MSESKQLEHKMCNLTPAYANASGVQFKGECGRGVLYIDSEILKLTPYTLKEIRYYLFHKGWEWLKPCDRKECEFDK